MALGIASGSINTAGNSSVFVVNGNTGILSTPGSAPITGLFLRCTLNGIPNTQIYIPDGAASITGLGLNITVPSAVIPATAANLNLEIFGCNIQDTLGTQFPGGGLNFPYTNSSTATVGASLAILPTNCGMNATYYDTAGTPNRRTWIGGLVGAEVPTFDTVLNIGTAGSSVNFLVHTNASAFSFSVSIDGSAYTVYTPQAFEVDNVIQISSSLSSGDHPISIKYISGTLALNTDNVFQVYGGTATMRSPLSGTGSAPSFWATTYPASSFSQYAVTTGANAANALVTFETGTTPAGTNDPNQGWLLDTGYAWAFHGKGGPSLGINTVGTPTGMYVYLNTTIGLWDLRVNNISVGQEQMDTTAIMKFVNFSSLLPGTGGATTLHLTSVAPVNNSSYIGSIIIVGTTLTTPPTARPLLIPIGDSRTAGVGVINQYGQVLGPLHSWAYEVANAGLGGSGGLAYINQGISGATYEYTNLTGETPTPTLSIEYAVVTNNIVIGNNHPGGVSYVVDYGGINTPRQQTGSLPHTTTSAAITSTGSQSVNVSSITGFTNGLLYWVDIGGADPYGSPGPNCEQVMLNFAAGQATGNFTKTHANGVTISQVLTGQRMQTSFFNCLNTILSGSSTVQVLVIGMGPTNSAGNATAYGLLAGTNGVVDSPNLFYLNGLKQLAFAPSGTTNGGNRSGTYLTSPQIARVKYLDPVPLLINSTNNQNYVVTNNATPPPTPLPGTQSNYTVNYAGDGIHENGAGNILIANGAIGAFASPATSYTQTLASSTGFTFNPMTITYTPNGTTTALLTPVVSGVSGTFSPTTINFNNTTPVTVNFTPTTAGTATLSSSAPGLTSPSPNTYTVSASSVSNTIGAVTFTLTGVGTLWTGTPFSIVSGGGSITSQTATDNTHATLTITGGTSPWVISDGSRQFTLKASASGGGGSGGLVQNFVNTSLLNV
jgi:hypothetical protein